MSKQSVLIVGFGVFQESGGGVQTKSAIAEYLNTWNENYQVTWATQGLKGEDLFSGIVDPSVGLVPLGRNILANYFRLAGRARGEPEGGFACVVAAYPGLLLVAPWLMAIGKSTCRVIYIGNDYNIRTKTEKPFLRALDECKRLWRSFWIKRLTRFSDAIIARGKRLAASFSELNVPIFETVPITQISSASVQASTSMALPQRYVLFVGGLSEEKGFDLLLSGYALALNSNTDLPDLVAVGAGPLETAAGTKNSKVHLLGFVDDPVRLTQIFLGAERLFVPSRPWGEGVPRVIEEAMACGVDVVSTALDTVQAEYGETIQYFPSVPPSPDEIARSFLTPRPKKKASDSARLLGAANAAKQHIDIVQQLMAARPMNNR